MREWVAGLGLGLGLKLGLGLGLGLGSGLGGRHDLAQVGKQVALAAALARDGVSLQRAEACEAGAHLLCGPRVVGQQRRHLLQVGEQHAPGGKAVTPRAARLLVQG